MQKISSKENMLIKHICKLREKKYRNEYNEFIIEGAKIVKEAIQEKVQLKHIIINEQAINRGLIEKFLKEELKNLEYIEVTNSVFNLITEVENPQGILAVIDKSLEDREKSFEDDIVLVLDDIQDPGNLGTIIRTADSVGLKKILVSKGTVDAYNSKVIRSTMGAIFRVKLIECDNLIEVINEYKQNDYKIMVTSLNATTSIYDINLMKNVIVIGNEANGVSKEILNIADTKALIPMIGKTESLNASVATGVILYEYIRQKLYK